MSKVGMEEECTKLSRFSDSVASMQHSAFRTQDLSLTAALLHKGQRLEELDRSGRNTVFLFQDSPELQEIVAQYWRDELLCPAQSLLSSLKRAKHILYDYSV